MNTITIHYINSVYIKIDCERGIAKEINDFFAFKVPNYQFTPAFRNKLWNGEIHLFNLVNGYLYRGLLNHILVFCKDRNYKIEFPNIPEYDIPTDLEIDTFLKSIPIKSGGKDISLHDHQIDAIKKAISDKRLVLLSPTGSGKSLIIYFLIKYLLKELPIDKKILIIVPTTGLVTQMLNDFKDYSNGSIEKECHIVYAGREKTSHKRVIISTWQSIYLQPKEYFDQFGGVLGDEAHLYQSKSLTSIMTKLTDCDYRIGTTGTLSGVICHKLVLEGLFGSVFSVTSTKDLMNKDLLSKLHIECLILQHPENKIMEIKKAKYQDELDWLVRSKERNHFIKTLVSKVKGNTLVLFNFVEKHGLPLFDLIKNDIPTSINKRPVFFVSGAVDALERENIRNIVEKHKIHIILEFGDDIVSKPSGSLVSLTDGSKKKIEDITTNDDIDDIWVKSNIL